MNEPLNQDALRQKLGDARKASSADQMIADADQMIADADQLASDADQISSDTDQTASDRDQTVADRDQQASDQDQATADRDRAADPDLTTADATAYESSREEREGASLERLGNRIPRHATARDRHEAATDRDRMADIRDEGGRGRDANAASLALPSTEREAQLLRELGELRAGLPQTASGRRRIAPGPPLTVPMRPASGRGLRRSCRPPTSTSSPAPPGLGRRRLAIDGEGRPIRAPGRPAGRCRSASAWRSGARAG